MLPGSLSTAALIGEVSRTWCRDDCFGSRATGSESPPPLPLPRPRFRAPPPRRPRHQGPGDLTPGNTARAERRPLPQFPFLIERRRCVMDREVMVCPAPRHHLRSIMNVDLASPLPSRLSGAPRLLPFLAEPDVNRRRCGEGRHSGTELQTHSLS